MKIKSIILLFFALIFISCESTQDAPELTHKEKLLSQQAHDFRSYEDFFDPASKLSDRVRTGDDFITDLLLDYEGGRDYNYYQPTESELTLLEDYFALLPKKYIEVLEERLLAIYFVEDFFASGMTDYVLVPDNDEIYCILFFEPELINVPMQDWVTKKENTCFFKESDSLDIKISLASDYTGLMYILAHECTHVMDYVTEITPYVEPDIGELRDAMDATSAFTDNIWDEYRTPTDSNNFVYRASVTFYGYKGGPLISNANAFVMYEELMETKFVSLYGSLNWAEDLAEYMTFYHLTQKLGIDYRIELYYQGELFFSYAPFYRNEIISRFNNLPDFYQ